MKGYSYRCMNCRATQIVPRSKAKYTDGRVCSECGSSLVSMGEMEYGIDVALKDSGAVANA